MDGPKTVSRSAVQDQDQGYTTSSRIEQLPDDMLVHILSFLPTLAEKSVTAILSRRWRYVWHNITHFDFDPSTLLLPGEPALVRLCKSHDWYISSINSFIQARAAAPAELVLVKHLLFRYQLGSNHSRDIDNWINFAISNRVETLHLDFGVCYGDKQYKLSEGLWYSAPSGLSSIKCLKSLFLRSVSISKQFVEFVLSNCPLLEILSLDHAGNFTHLDISSVPPLRLKQLKIISFEHFALDALSAPYLTSLYHELGKFVPQVIHVPMLSDLTLGCFDRTMHMDEHLQHFWSYLPQLRRLELRIIPSQNFKFTKMPKLATLRYLKMTVFWNINPVLCEIIKFLNACPLLETFALQVRCKSAVPEHQLFEPENLGSNQTLYRELEKSCVFESLKVLELYGADGGTVYLNVVECLICKSPNLQKLIVDTRDTLPFPEHPSPEIVEAVKAYAKVLCEERYPQIDIKVIG